MDSISEITLKTKKVNEGLLATKNVIKKPILCIKERRSPYIVTEKIEEWAYKNKLRFKTFIYNLANNLDPLEINRRYLYASPCGKQGKDYLKKIIKQFGYKSFDYLIFVYDDGEFKDEIFNGCIFIYEKGLKWQFAWKYLTPEYCHKYEYIFFWDDDIEIDGFSYKNFLDIMRLNNLEVAQPALCSHSFYSHKLTLKDNDFKYGRFTDFVEIMVPVFETKAWFKFRNMIKIYISPSGWGYDFLAKSFCKYINMGIIDCESVTHTRPVRSQKTNAPLEMKLLFKEYRGYRIASGISYGKLNRK